MDVPLRKAKKSLDWVVSGPRFALDNPTKKCNNQGNDASDQVLRLLLRWGDGYLQQLPDLQFPVRIECELAIIHYGQVSFGQIGGFSNLHTKNGGSIPFRGLIHLCLNGVAAAFDAAISTTGCFVTLITCALPLPSSMPFIMRKR